MPHTLDDLLVGACDEDRKLLVALCTEYLQLVAGRNNIILSMWAHPDSWSPELRSHVDLPSPEMVAQQARIEKEFTRVFGPSGQDARIQVTSFLLGWFNV